MTSKVTVKYHGGPEDGHTVDVAVDDLAFGRYVQVGVRLRPDTTQFAFESACHLYRSLDPFDGFSTEVVIEYVGIVPEAPRFA